MPKHSKVIDDAKRLAPWELTINCWSPTMLEITDSGLMMSNAKGVWGTWEGSERVEWMR